MPLSTLTRPRLACSILASLVLVACGSPATGPDGGATDGDVTGGCSTNADCTGGLVCQSGACVKSVPQPAAGGIGAHCTANTACTAGTSPDCITAGEGAPGGYCTSSCTTNSDCGAGNACQTASTDENGNSTPFCTHDCDRAADCKTGYLCLAYQGQNFCWYPCQSADDCIDSQNDTCDTTTGLCTGETLVGNTSKPDAGSCTATGCSPTANCQDNCGNADMTCASSCDPNSPGHNNCGGVDSQCGTVPDAGPGNFVTVPLTGCPFLGYDAPVTIDSQTFELDVDTGSTTTFVAASSCSNCGVSPEYDPPSGADTGMTTSSQYGSGAVQGEVYSDKVHVGGEMPAVTMDFGGITQQSQFFLSESCSGTGGQQGEGILGMGPIDLDTIGSASSDAYFTDLVAQSAGIAHVFAVNLCTSCGNMWFGGYDTSFASGAPSYTPLGAMTTNQPYWEVSVSSIGLGTTTFAGSGDAHTVLDTGTGVFIMPSAAYTALVKALSTNAAASSVFGAGKLSATFFGNGGCAAALGGMTQAEVDAALPALTVTLPKVGGGTFTLQMPASQSYLALMQGEYCGAIASNADSGGETIWGAPALRAYIEIFDVGGKQVGFAPQSSCK